MSYHGLVDDNDRAGTHRQNKLRLSTAAGRAHAAESSKTRLIAEGHDVEPDVVALNCRKALQVTVDAPCSEEHRSKIGDLDLEEVEVWVSALGRHTNSRSAS